MAYSCGAEKGGSLVQPNESRPRYVTVAEVAVAVVDDWQGMGVGGRLTAALAARAREEGITSFTALVLADNELILKLLGDLGEVRVVSSELGTVELIVDLHESGLKRLKRVLKAVARGEIIPFGRSGGIDDDLAGETKA